jgi:hypothetical protein
VPSLDILDNVVPHIGGEEEKMEWETSKILGDVDAASGSGFSMPEIPVSPLYRRLINRYLFTAIVSLFSTAISFHSHSPSKINLLQALRKSHPPCHLTSLKFKVYHVHLLQNKPS